MDTGALNKQLIIEHSILVGHKSAIVALCVVKTETDALLKTEDVLISASEDGYVHQLQAVAEYSHCVLVKLRVGMLQMVVVRQSTQLDFTVFRDF